MKPIAGIIPLWDDEKDSLWMLPGYMEGLRAAGVLPVMLPLTADDEEISQLVSMCDGFLFTGGHDVAPEIYGETPLENLVCTCPMRDAMEIKLLKLALEQDKPILGICRGIQLINAALGGTLYQDLPLQHPSKTEHHQTPPYDVPIHEIDIIENTPLYANLHKDKLSVNSYHHQAVKDLTPVLSPMAVSEDGLIEAVYKPDARFVWAVQWHPEFSYKVDGDSRAIFEAFAGAMRG